MAGIRNPVTGIVGKLPAHGDFVRRGGPAAVLALLDHWLDRELGAAVATGMAPEDAVAALDGGCCAFSHADDLVLASIVASGDRVGRRFPLVATLAGADPGHDAAEAWCVAAAAALAAVRDAAGDADAALAAVASISPVAAAPANPDVPVAPVAGWWRAGGAAAGTGLPTGDAFRALLARARA